MRHALWPVALAGLGLGSLAMVGGTAIGGEIAPLAVGYGLLVALAALYMAAGLAIRDRTWRRIGRPGAHAPTVNRLAGRRVF
jgi:4-hydroxybenzoate polyprenyltransferase